MQQGGGYGVVARIQDDICEVTVQGRDKEEFVRRTSTNSY